MNQNTQTIVTLIHYNVAVRDTLEYCLQKDAYDVNLFQAKKNTLLTEVNNNTPLKSILDHSGDNGKKMDEAIRAMVEEVYGEKSTICKISGGNLVVDHAQHLAIFAHVLPIHDNITSMIRGVIADGEAKAAAAKTEEEKAALSMADARKLWAAEDAMFRAVAFLTLVNELNRLFNEYNIARNEAHGENTPASNFIGQDIQKVIGYINGCRGNAIATNLVYKAMEDKINALVENCIGRRDLPAGKRFPDVQREVLETINLYLRDAEATMNSIYPDMIKGLIEQVKADQAKAASSAPTQA
ncbi:MAG: hypothetical protein SPI58_00050 [Candidatus Enteromonas sp.]|nr:hypothetical protein [Candidatus Enteromonas sp.]MDY6093427.1 hypothetical protein [Candidatus Enteromonas sp.]